MPGDANKDAITLSSSDGGTFTPQPTVVLHRVRKTVCHGFANKVPQGSLPPQAVHPIQALRRKEIRDNRQFFSQLKNKITKGEGITFPIEAFVRRLYGGGAAMKRRVARLIVDGAIDAGGGLAGARDLMIGSLMKESLRDTVGEDGEVIDGLHTQLLSYTDYVVQHFHLQCFE